VVVAPVQFGAAALTIADVLSTDLEPAAGPPSGEAGAPATSGAGAAAAVAPPIAEIAPAAVVGALLIAPDAA
jgi:hypothetical protein